jgi:protein ImuB
MRLAAARSKLPELQALPRSPAAEREALEAIAAWLCQFTPSVSLEPPRAIVMEVAGSLRIFGGSERLLKALQRGVQRLGFGASIAQGRTPRAALWRAVSGQSKLAEVPVAAFAAAGDLQFLQGIGVRRIGDLAKLPRNSFAKRASAQLLAAFDQAAGRCPEPRAFFVPPETFSVKLALPAEVTQAQAVLFAAHRLLEQLGGFLAVRHAGVRRLVLTLIHRHAPAPVRIPVGLSAPSRDVGHLTSLLRERLDALALASPVDALGLDVEELAPLPGYNADFLGGGRQDEGGWSKLVERLRARLGEQGVEGLALHGDHRPELAWRRVEPGARGTAAAALPEPRPLWLLDPPQAIREGEFVSLKGPERIESGWWDGREAARDYFIAQLRDQSLAWIYRDLRNPGWYVHGIFA